MSSAGPPPVEDPPPQPRSARSPARTPIPPDPQLDPPLDRPKFRSRSFSLSGGLLVEFPGGLWSRRGFTRQPENFTRQPSASNTTKIPREDPQREKKKEAKLGAGEGKKKRNFSLPTLRAEALRAPLFSGFGPQHSSFYLISHLFFLCIFNCFSFLSFFHCYCFFVFSYILKISFFFQNFFHFYHFSNWRGKWANPKREGVTTSPKIKLVWGLGRGYFPPKTKPPSLQPAVGGSMRNALLSDIISSLLCAENHFYPERVCRRNLACCHVCRWVANELPTTCSRVGRARHSMLQGCDHRPGNLV